MKTLLDDQTALRSFERKSPEYQKAVFNDKELNALKEMKSLRETSRTAERIAGNPSESGKAIVSAAQLAAIGAGVAKFIAHPIVGAVDIAANVIGPYAAAKTYIGTSRGVNASLGPRSIQGIRAASQPATSGNKEEIHREFVRRFVKRIQ
jgi:hypothetical protein